MYPPIHYLCRLALAGLEAGFTLDRLPVHLRNVNLLKKYIEYYVDYCINKN